MVFKKSEYRKKYRDPRWDSHFSHYKEKVDYRIQRRCQEHHHQVLDWDWDSENGTEEDYNLNNNSNQARLAGRPRQSRMEGRGGDVSDKTVQTPEWSRTREMPPQQPNDRCSEPHEQRDAEQSKGHRQKAGHQKQTLKDRRRARPKTAPDQRVDMKKAKTDPQPPLVAFGWADQELTTGAKKTHNIRASADPLQIYPSALRAMRRRELEIQRERSRSAGKNLREQKLKAVFNIPPKDDTVWLTEYQRNYAGPTKPR